MSESNPTGESSKPIQTMTLKEFYEEGYLQELNRRFLHPLGLAIGLYGDFDEDDDFHPSGKIQIQDYREDPEGMRFAKSEIGEEFIQDAKKIEKERQRKYRERLEVLGYVIQPLPDAKDE